MSWVKELFAGLRDLIVWWVTVAPWEQALRVRLGKHVQRLETGVHLRIPGIDRVYRQSIRRRTCDLSMQTLTTSDGATVTVAGSLRYAIADIELLYQTLHHAESTLMDLAGGIVARTITQLARSECTADAIEAAVRRELDIQQYGLTDAELYVTSFAFVRTYRLIQDGRWSVQDDRLNTVSAEGAQR